VNDQAVNIIAIHNLAGFFRIDQRPLLLDLREEMHKMLRLSVEARKEFRFSELVDLTVYYFSEIYGVQESA